MNIFPIDKDPKTAAHWACDQHVVKIISEAVLVYSSAMHNVCPKKWQKLKDKKGIAWGPIKIPLVKWAEDDCNRAWLREYIQELYKQYHLRYNKTHKAYDAFLQMQKAYGVNEFKKCPDYCLITFIQVMPEEFKGEDAVNAYRCYYRYKYEKGFKRPMRWKNDGCPPWLKS